MAADENVTDIDLDDPKVKDATLKIQAGFGRIMAMKKISNALKSKKEKDASTQQVDY